MSQQSEEANEPDTIKSVSPGEGEPPYVTARHILERSGTLVERELAGIAPWLKSTGHDKDTLMGLAFSGGGIRSATFSLGVMQALAKHDVLKKMDYLSTVSGGGYIGSSLSWWLKKNDDGGDQVGLGPNDFPFGSDKQSDSATDTPAQKRLRHLSQHGKFLTPGKGITVLSGIATVLRAILVNLAVWLPILIVVMMLLVWGSAGLAGWFPEGRVSWLPALLPEGLPIWGNEAFIFRNMLRLAVLLALLFALFCLAYSLRTAAERGKTSSSRYDWRRWFEQITGRGLAAIGALVVVGSVPVVANSLAGTGGDAAVAGPGAVLVGLGSAIWSFFKAGQKQAGKIPLGVLASLGAAFLVYGLLLTAYAVAAFLYHKHGGGPFWMLLAAFAAFALVMGWFANVNYISPHRFYRDRLMETFLPNPETARDNETAAATDADPVRLSDVNNAGDGRGPYHIVNTNVLLVNALRRRWRIRGGDNFILSPLYCGSNATGWCATEDFLGDGMTLATAMAISGAAANPNTGMGGVGLTRNPLVSILMALLNLRLGYWAHHPLSPPKWSWGRRPNHFLPGMYEVGSLIHVGGLREDRSFVQLSDGGHFENLAFYELIRRKLRLIIVCDGSGDVEFKFANLQTTLRRIEADFGASVKFEGDNRPATLVPSQDAGYPMGSKRSPRGHIVGDITYHDGTLGKLILLKTTMVPGVSTAVKGYKGEHPDFPDETTADQFFDEDQFEAYRELGHHIGHKMATGLNLPQFIGDIEKAAGKYVPTP
jgi:predicted acylesterase/phospholipase RssA